MSSTVKVPYFFLSISGKEIDEYRMNMIESIVFEDNATGSDLLTVTMYDPDLKILSDNIFVEECPITFIGGWYQGDTVKFEGWISIIDIDFPENGTPMITINCMDNTHLMNRQKKQRTWNNVKASDVAIQIFKEYGLSYKVDATDTVEENISQSDTDIQLLLQLANDQYETYLCYVEGTKGYFIKKPNLANPQSTLEYRQGNGNLLSFSPRINKQTKQIQVDKSEVNTKDNNVDKGSSNNTTSRPTSGNTVAPSDKNTSGSSSSGGSWKYENGKWVQK